MKKKRMISAVLALLLIASVSFSAYAVSKTVSISVVYNNIKLVIDGKQFTPKDVQGNVVEPFIYNGTTYVPLRAVGEAFGKEVNWDGATATVTVGGKTIKNLDEMGAYEFSSSTGHSKYSSAGKTEIYRGEKYQRCVLIDHTTAGERETVENTKLSYLLDKEYTSFYTTLDAMNERTDFSPTILKIYGDGKLLYTSPAFTCDSEAFDLELDVKGVSILSFECESKSASTYAGGSMGRTVILGEARLLK